MRHRYHSLGSAIDYFLLLLVLQRAALLCDRFKSHFQYRIVQHISVPSLRKDGAVFRYESRPIQGNAILNLYTRDSTSVTASLAAELIGADTDVSICGN